MARPPLTDPTDAQPADASSILLKAFAILDVLGRDARALTLSQLARSSGLSKSTAHRVVGQLLALGVIRRHSDGYRTGPRVSALTGRSVDDVLLELALPRVRELHLETERTLLVSRWHGGTVTYLEQVPGAFGRAAATVIGARTDALTTPEGRTLLAHFPPPDIDAALGRHDPPLSEREVVKLRRRLHHIRARGGVHDESSVVTGLRCACAPVIVGGAPVLALSVTFEPEPGGGRRYAGPLRSAARDIGRTLERHPLRVTLPLL